MTLYLVDEETLKDFIRAERKSFCSYLDYKYYDGYCSDNHVFSEMTDEEVMAEINSRFKIWEKKYE